MRDREEIQALMQEYCLPGVSIVVIENALITLELNLGVKNSQTNAPIDQDTLFEAASLSKPVFTYGALQLVEKGQLDLDRPLVDYLRINDTPDKRVEHITARMVLTHSTGFPNWRPKDEPLNIHFQPGERFSYSGEGFLYLQKVVEHLSGLPLEEYIKSSVFEPLEMKQSTFLWVDSPFKASGHDAKGMPIENQQNVPPNAAFTLHTTARDYGKFTIALLKGFGLTTKMMNEMFRAQIKVPEESTSSIDKSPQRLSEYLSWGLGFGLQSNHAFWHWGDNGGFKSYVIGDRDSQNAFIIFTNGANGLFLVEKIMISDLGAPQPSLEWLRHNR